MVVVGSNHRIYKSNACLYLTALKALRTYEYILKIKKLLKAHTKKIRMGHKEPKSIVRTPRLTMIWWMTVKQSTKSTIRNFRLIFELSGRCAFRKKGHSRLSPHWWPPVALSDSLSTIGDGHSGRRVKLFIMPTVDCPWQHTIDHKRWASR